jgi:CheY-like chemotaxis protein
MEPGEQDVGRRSLIRELAHELRDALSPLASSVDVARLRNFDADASRLLAERVERGLRRALATLDAFALAEQCENGALPLALGTVPLVQILQDARAALGVSEPGRFDFGPVATGNLVRADATRSAEVLAAVLQHAAASAALNCAVEVRADSTTAQSHIRVRSRGDPANVPGEEWLAGYRRGEGRMALRIARHIMRLQGGGLDLITSNDGAFELVLRFAAAGTHAESPRPESRRPQASAPQRQTATCRAGARVLIVDDSREVRRTYHEALAALGYEVTEAADAEQALGALEATKPDVALIDIHLPRMNGYRLAQAIRARAGTAIYLVMLSGMALDEVTRSLAREAGFDDCLDKMAGPVALRELLAGNTSRR